MTLKRQLLVASLLMLLIPWTGLSLVLELDRALREQALQQLRHQAVQLAGQAGDALLDIPAAAPGTPVIYVDSLSQPIQLDGYGAEWPGFDEESGALPWQTASQTTGPGLRWHAASDGHALFLLLRRNGQRTRFYSPAHPDQPHDRVWLQLYQPPPALEQAPLRQSWLLRPVAPGNLWGLTGASAATRDHRVRGFWETARGGWQLELQLPRPPEGSRLGFSHDRGDPEAGSRLPPARLLYRLPDLERRLASYLNPGQQLLLLEADGWVRVDSHQPGDTDPAYSDSLSPLQVLEQISLNLLRHLVQWLQPAPLPVPAPEPHRLAPESLPEQGLVTDPDQQRWLMVTQTVPGQRILILRQSLEQLLTLSGSTLGRVIARSALVIVTLMLALLGYASWLSWRITRLQTLVSATVDADGRLTGQLPPARAGDELGQLQTRFARMVSRLRGYHAYLESFSRRLTHELKTPVAVVRSSLENLAHAASDEERAQYTERALAATERLRRILHGMSEAARLEQSFDHTDREPFDLAVVVSQASAAYQALSPQHDIRYQGPLQGASMTGSPEHMVQLLDKLVDNARDFTPAGGLIRIALEYQPQHLILSVFNQGSHLPDGEAADIFGAFVSHRPGSGEGHLGQGLQMVRLIADYHGANVEAGNHTLEGVDGVRFRVIIPTRARSPGNTP